MVGPILRKLGPGAISCSPKEKVKGKVKGKIKVKEENKKENGDNHGGRIYGRASKKSKVLNSTNLSPTWFLFHVLKSMYFGI